MPKRIVFLWFFSILCAISVSGQPVHIVAESGEQIYGGQTYEVFESFSSDTAGISYLTPLINDRGDTAFFARIGGPVGAADTAIFSKAESGAAGQMARRFHTVPGYPAGTQFDRVSAWILTEQADVVFKSRLTGSQVQLDDWGIWIATPASFVELVRSGSVAPQTNPPLYFNRLSPNSDYNPFLVQTTSSAIVGIPARVNINPGSGTHGNFGVWMPQLPQPLRILETYPAPGITNAVVLTAQYLSRQDSPIAVYHATLSGPGVQALTFGSASVTTDAVIYADAAGITPVVVARKGQVVPHSSSQARLSTIFSTNGQEPVGLSDGSVVFGGNIIRADTGASLGEGLWRSNGVSTEQIFVTGQSISNAPGFTLASLGNTVNNRVIVGCEGQPVFLGKLAGPGVTYLNELGIFQKSAAGDLSLIARARQQAPGVAPDVIFSSYSLYDKIVCSTDGRFAFSAQVQGPGVTSINDRGVWFVENGQAQLVFREGMQIGDLIIREIKSAADTLQISADGRIIVRATAALASNPYGSIYDLVLSWTPCQGATVLARIGAPVDLPTGQSSSVMFFRIDSQDALNNQGEVVMVLRFPSQPAGIERLIIFPSPSCAESCPADTNNNGVADVPDIFAFLSLWFAGGSGADFNNDGAVTVADIFAFLSAWFAGC